MNTSPQFAQVTNTLARMHIRRQLDNLKNGLRSFSIGYPILPQIPRKGRLLWRDVRQGQHSEDFVYPPLPVSASRAIQPL